MILTRYWRKLRHIYTFQFWSRSNHSDRLARGVSESGRRRLQNQSADPYIRVSKMPKFGAFFNLSAESIGTPYL